LLYSIVLGQRNVRLTDGETRGIVEAYANPEHTNDVFGGSSMVDASSEVLFPWFVPSALRPIFELMLESPLVQRNDVVDALCGTVASSNRFTASLVCQIIRAYLGNGSLAESDRVLGPHKKGLLRVLNEVLGNDALWEDSFGLEGAVQRLLGIEDSASGRHELHQFIERYAGEVDLGN
jgi:hypothetical protein